MVAPQLAVAVGTYPYRFSFRRFTCFFCTHDSSHFPSGVVVVGWAVVGTGVVVGFAVPQEEDCQALFPLNWLASLAAATVLLQSLHVPSPTEAENETATQGSAVGLAVVWASHNCLHASRLALVV